LPLLRCEKAMHEVEGASHLFGEPGKVEEMARLSAQWFHDHLAGPTDLTETGRGLLAYPLTR
jgi:hypothetical protein